jgi:transposase
VNGAGRVVRLVLSPGQAGDAPRAPALLDGLRPGHVIADAAYDSDAIRDQVRRARAQACIRPNPTRTRKKRYDRERYKGRNVIERFFDRSSGSAGWPPGTRRRQTTTSDSPGSPPCSSDSGECPHYLERRA